MERFAKTFISTNKVRPQSEHLALGTDLGTLGLFNVSRKDRLPAKAEGQAIHKAMGEMLGITGGTQLSPNMKPLLQWASFLAGAAGTQGHASRWGRAEAELAERGFLAAWGYRVPESLQALARLIKMSI